MSAVDRPARIPAAGGEAICGRHIHHSGSEKHQAEILGIVGRAGGRTSKRRRGSLFMDPTKRPKSRRKTPKVAPEPTTSASPRADRAYARSGLK